MKKPRVGESVIAARTVEQVGVIVRRQKYKGRVFVRFADGACVSLPEGAVRPCTALVEALGSIEMGATRLRP